ncbi:hypothetical protein GCM10023321_65420 [Pseudonocardia eucalypti]|uniref:HIT domain-containing protein n=1 Tax=Pseudonocardia eucalypti TaxID=648755 RepID=A0ABP9QYS0_9PSEU|nr:diadenosine tetraphosphate (Ap4A) HIT family hydrolase [Pseudonocardia eucalypti]
MDNDQLYARLDALARGEADNLIAELRSGYAVFGDEQWLPGYCLLIHRDRVRHLDELPLAGRTEFLAEMSLLGEALRAAASAFDAGFGRVNYEILGNSWPQLHAHVFPRYRWEPDRYRRMPVWLYPPDDRPAPLPPDRLATLRSDITARLTDLARAGGSG